MAAQQILVLSVMVRVHVAQLIKLMIMEMIKDPISNVRMPLDEMQYIQCCEAIHNDPEIRYLLNCSATLEINSLPLAILIQNNIGVRYIYSPEYYRVKANIESQIQIRINQIKQHYPLIIKYYE